VIKCSKHFSNQPTGKSYELAQKRKDWFRNLSFKVPIKIRRLFIILAHVPWPHSLF